MDNTASVGGKLRLIRLERKLSQRALAERAGVSANAVSLIERNQISPSVATLQCLAGALRVHMSYFFESDREAAVIHAAAGDRPKLVSGGMTVEGIGARLPEQACDPFYLTLDPHADAGLRVAHAGHELVCCVRGHVDYEVDGIIHRLAPGDFLLFEASLPHYWCNPGEEVAELLLVLNTPEPAGDLARMHFAENRSVSHMA